MLQTHDITSLAGKVETIWSNLRLWIENFLCFYVFKDLFNLSYFFSFFYCFSRKTRFSSNTLAVKRTYYYLIAVFLVLRTWDSSNRLNSNKSLLFQPTITNGGGILNYSSRLTFPYFTTLFICLLNFCFKTFDYLFSSFFCDNFKVPFCFKRMFLP